MDMDEIQSHVDSHNFLGENCWESASFIRGFRAAAYSENADDIPPSLKSTEIEEGEEAMAGWNDEDTDHTDDTNSSEETGGVFPEDGMHEEPELTGAFKEAYAARITLGQGWNMRETRFNGRLANSAEKAYIKEQREIEKERKRAEREARAKAAAERKMT